MKSKTKGVSLTNVVLIYFFLPVIFCSCEWASNQQGSDKPTNVLLITADDLNYNSIGAYGCGIKNITPNLDLLAENGIRFNHAYVNIAVCQPSRQSILTGRYPRTNGALAFDPISENVTTLTEQLHKAGYLNGILGKEIHLRPTEKFFWDYFVKEGDLASGMGIGRDPELYYGYAKEFFLRAKDNDKPFFLMANSHDPHRPFAGSEQEQMLWGEDLPISTRKISPEEVTVPDFLPDLPEVRLEIAEYYSSVYRLDQTVGAILRALEESGLRENTIVIFLSDNGMAFPFAKSNCYLNSNKTPWIISWPKLVQKGVVDDSHFISGIDFMPTILHALRLPEVEDMDGQSFLPILEGKTQKNRNIVFTEFHRIYAGIDYSMRGVQERNFGYIANFWSDGKQKIRGDAASGRTYRSMQAGALEDSLLKERLKLYEFRVPEELYDFEADPDALVNLIDNPEYADVKIRLKELLAKNMEETKDHLRSQFESTFMNK